MHFLFHGQTKLNPLISLGALLFCRNIFGKKADKKCGRLTISTVYKYAGLTFEYSGGPSSLGFDDHLNGIYCLSH